MFWFWLARSWFSMICCSFGPTVFWKSNATRLWDVNSMVELVKGWTELRYLFIVWYRVGMGRRGMSKRFLFSISVCDKKEEENVEKDCVTTVEHLDTSPAIVTNPKGKEKEVQERAKAKIPSNLTPNRFASNSKTKSGPKTC